MVFILSHTEAEFAGRTYRVHVHPTWIGAADIHENQSKRTPQDNVVSGLGARPQRAAPRVDADLLGNGPIHDHQGGMRPG